jgi:outer membrane lipoprotein carrier protein
MMVAEKKMALTHRAYRLILTAVAFLFALGPVSSARAQSVQEAVTLVENHYSNTQTLTAKVTQKNFLKAVGRTQTFDGVLSIKKPGKLRIDYTNGQIILVDGKTALFYSKKSEQMIKKTFSDVQEMNVPVAFLLGAGHIREDFDVLQPDPKAPLSLELLPKKPAAAMKKLNITADEKGRITTIAIFDRSGNRTDILFTDAREGVSIEDKLFSFKPPKGTEVIEQ